jgi:hypothetical protein
MESWTRLVGDEVLSKWIILVLAVSVALNGFENGPRPVANSLAMLNNEEVILLSQKGKIAAYLKDVG